MARDAIPLTIPDAALFARRLADSLAGDPRPGHLRLLNHLARAAGHANWQGARAAAARPEPVLAPEPVNADRVARAARAFDAEGRMARWPSGTAVQGLCLWALWARLPSRRNLTEREVSDILMAQATFGDPALLRRSLIDHGLAVREPGGTAYRRVERPPPAEARALMARLGRPEGR